MKILITGGAGFIGSNLADKLIARGDTVCVIDNLLTGRKDNLNPQVAFCLGSIANAELLESFFKYSEPDVVIHAAASGKDPNNWQVDVDNNVTGTVNVVKNSIKYNVKKLIYFQTSLCYGPPVEQPITLKHQINPLNSYAITKTAAEQFIFMSGLNYTSFRLANCYGPRNLAGPIPTFYLRLSKNLPCFVFDTARDFIFINDLMEIVFKAIDGKQKGVYHISTGGSYPIKDIFDIVTELMEKKIDVKVRPKLPEDVYSILIDPSKTIKDFNFIPKTFIKDGISQALAWYQTHDITETYTHLNMVK
jgi:UDP-glucose 4-epimerase